ncbi:MAG: DUF3097 domain-containing protein [Actinobacteria bacterium]|nr:DUF3097 domain-containing protein [Actinomycetota bacterium]
MGADDRYARDVLTTRRAPRVVEVAADRDLVVEDAGSGFCGAVVDCAKGAVTLEDRHGRRRVFPMVAAGFLLDGSLVTLVPPVGRAGPVARQRTASGSIAVPGAPARVARASRIYVEGVHDATLVERIWGDDLRVEGVVVEPLDGIDDLPGIVRGFRPGPGRRLGVLVDHLVAGSKETRIVAEVEGPHVLVTGHPYVDVWQAVKPAAVGIAGWPEIPRGVPWKEGVCRALGVPGTAEMWRRVQRGVRGYGDVEVPLLRAVEELIDFVTADGTP